MKRVIFLVGCFVLVCMLSNCFISASEAQTRRALLVGINQYRPESDLALLLLQDSSIDKHQVESRSSRQTNRGHFGNLDGCINDVDSVYGIITTRFGFKPQNVMVLKDSMASRKRILSEFRHFLIDAASPGDEIFFYFAGHGSLVRNLTPSPIERDSIDASLVPSDSYLGEHDIRSKEVRRLSNDALGRGLVLTMIVDACHSGTISRGIPAMGKSRFVDPDPNPVSDTSDPGPIPAEKGALIISAAQAHESAIESKGPDGADHGAFTAALIEVLRQASTSTPAVELFARVRALMHTDANSQEPNFQGNQRRNSQLFGGSAKDAGHAIRVPVLKVDAEKGTVQFEGGTALGIYPNAELHREGVGGDSLTRVRISEVQGINRSVAKVIEGDPRSIRPSQLFEIDRWTLPDQALLRVWLPACATFLLSSSGQTKAQLNALRTEMASSWVEDPTEESPTHVISWDGKSWSLRSGEKTIDVGAELNLDKIKSLLAGSAKRTDAKLFVHIPPTEELAAALRAAAARGMGGVEIVARPTEAHYLLAGRFNGQSLDYAWIMPNKTREDGDSTSMPIRTDWLHLGAGTGDMKLLSDSLEEMLFRLERIRGWLTLDGPSEDPPFPYTLSLKKTAGGALKSGGIVFGDEQYKLVLKARREDLNNKVPPRYFYVFILESNGKSILLYPQDGNIGNHIPVVGRDSTYCPEELELPREPITIGEPYGVDTYFLLSSREAIEPSVLGFDGVRREMTRGDASALGSLLRRIGSGTRGGPVPTDWSIKRIQFLSRGHF